MRTYVSSKRIKSAHRRSLRAGDKHGLKNFSRLLNLFHDQAAKRWLASKRCKMFTPEFWNEMNEMDGMSPGQIFEIGRSFK